jgi:hypothetical protein
MHHASYVIQVQVLGEGPKTLWKISGIRVCRQLFLRCELFKNISKETTT